MHLGWNNYYSGPLVVSVLAKAYCSETDVAVMSDKTRCVVSQLFYLTVSRYHTCDICAGVWAVGGGCAEAWLAVGREAGSRSCGRGAQNCRSSFPGDADPQTTTATCSRAKTRQGISAYWARPLFVTAQTPPNPLATFQRHIWRGFAPGSPSKMQKNALGLSGKLAISDYFLLIVTFKKDPGYTYSHCTSGPLFYFN